VYKARDLHRPGEVVALKKVRIPLSDDGVPVSLIREIALLKQLENFQHPNIVRLLDICHGKRLEQERQLILYLVFEHVEQDLASYLEHCPAPGLGPDRIKDIMYQLLRGVDFLHSNRIVHRDLKPQNILVASCGVIKLADFGLARIYEQTQTLTTVVVTLWYRAPEVLLQSSYASPVDLWSCGCIYAELYRRRPLICGQSETGQLSKIFEVIGPPKESEWPMDISLSWRTFAGIRQIPIEEQIPEICPDGKSLLEGMLTFDSHKRITAKDALAHAYFVEYEQFPPDYNYGSNNSSQSSSSRRTTETPPST
jgi:serine/threonine protein kinase